MLGTVLIIVGILLAIISSVPKDTEETAASLIRLYANPGYIIFLVCIVGGGAAIQALHKRYEAAEAAGKPLRHNEIVGPVTYATFSALFGTQSVVFAKCMGELFSLWIVWLDSGKEEGSNSFAHWFTYFVIAAWLATAGIWLFRLNEALGKYNPLFIIPLLQSNFIFFAIVSGGIYFREFDAYEPLNWLGFWAGVLIMFYGLFLLSPDDMHDDDDDDDDDGGVGGVGGVSDGRYSSVDGADVLQLPVEEVKTDDAAASAVAAEVDKTDVTPLNLAFQSDGMTVVSLPPTPQTPLESARDNKTVRFSEGDSVPSSARGSFDRSPLDRPRSQSARGSIFGPNALRRSSDPTTPRMGGSLRMKLIEYEGAGRPKTPGDRPKTPGSARRSSMTRPMTPLGQAAQTKVAKLTPGLFAASPASHVHTIKLSAAALKEQYGDDHGRAHQAVAEGVRRRSSRVVVVDGEPGDRRPSGEGDSLSSTVGSGHRRASGARVLPVDASLEEASPAAERNASGENLKGP